MDKGRTYCPRHGVCGLPPPLRALANCFAAVLPVYVSVNVNPVSATRLAVVAVTAVAGSAVVVTAYLQTKDQLSCQQMHHAAAVVSQLSQSA